MTSEQWHKDKVVAYIVIGIIVVVGIGLYVYAEISAMSARQAAITSYVPVSASAPLSPQQVAMKSATVATFLATPQKALTKSQIATKLAVVKAWEVSHGIK
jgi:hypothetical protein